MKKQEIVSAAKTSYYLIVSSLEYLPHFNFQKRIVSAETIRGNTVYELFKVN